MTPLTQKTITYLKKERILPSPRWHFSAMRFFWCLGVVVALLLSGILTAISLHLLFEMNWSLLLSKDLGAKTVTLLSVPVLWLFLLSVFLFTATHCFRKIDEYYRYAIGKVIFVFLLVSFFLAILLEFLPIDNPMERAFLDWASPQVILKDTLK